MCKTYTVLKATDIVGITSHVKHLYLLSMLFKLKEGVRSPFLQKLAVDIISKLKLQFFSTTISVFQKSFNL